MVSKVTINVAAIYHKMFLFPWQQCMSKCIQMATTIIMFRILGNYYSFSRCELKRLVQIWAFLTIQFFILQDLKFNGNIMTRIPTEALIGPESLQNLQLQDNLIGKCTLLLHDTIVLSIIRWRLVISNSNL